MLKDLVLKNRSYRGYDRSRLVTREELVDLVELARICPSSINLQPLKFYLASDAETVSKIQPLTGWAKGLPELSLPYPGTEPTAFIVICIDRSIVKGGTGVLRDVGAVAQTMLLGAVEKGLGGCMIGSFRPEAVSEALSIPEGIDPELVVAIGKPGEEVILTDVKDGKVRYYRSEDGKTHYVPKRSLEELILN